MLLVLSLQGRAYALFKNLGTLTLLLVILPLNLLITLPAFLWSILGNLFKKKVLAERPKNVILTGAKMTKCLQIARSLHEAGHRVFMLETHKYWSSGNQYSNAVTGFYTVPDPQKDWQGYCQELLDIINRENIDVFIPISSAVLSYCESLVKPILSAHCEVFQFDAETTKMLDNKFEFMEKARGLDLNLPKFFLINKPEDILDFDFDADGSQYIVKSINYDSVRRLNMTKLPMDSREELKSFVDELPISPENPWIMQEFITGKEYCTHSTVREGKIRLHCCCESSEFQVNYDHIENQKIYEWVEKFVGELNLTGQISFDFIQTADNQVYPLECNPRTHSAITTFHDHPGVANAYLYDAEPGEEMTLKPLPDSKPTYWTYHELWRLTEIRSWDQLKAWLKRIREGTDAIFQINDPLPFLMVHHWQFPSILLDSLSKLKSWVMIDFNIGKLVELEEDSDKMKE